ncbi:MAG: CBS domain-containing protein [Bifidobacteriaceae bacterium]|jgi:CBS domain-containing protein|nr:CBS domain-containing protein [Bifidobacteriaceae bacterium]
MTKTSTRVFVARLAGTQVFDPIGDQVGRVRDVVALIAPKGRPRAVGLVVEVPGKRRVFLPFTRVTSIDVGQVLTTGLVNMRRFSQRPGETTVLGELVDRLVNLRDGDAVTIEDVAIESTRRGDWEITQLFVRFGAPAPRPLQLRRRGETALVDVGDVTDLAGDDGSQGVGSLVASLDGLKPADVADRLQEMSATRRLAVATALDDERLADIVQELGEAIRIEVLSALPLARAADVLEAMDPDDAADLIQELPPTQAAALLERMEPEDARDVRRLLAYGEESAGGLMTTEPVILGPEAPIANALAAIRRQEINPALASMAFVTRPPTETPTGRFLGVAHFQRLLREPPHRAIGDIIDQDTPFLEPADPLGKVTRLLATYNLTALPVVDTERRLLGAVSADDVLDHLLPDDWRTGDDDITDLSMGGGDG